MVKVQHVRHNISDRLHRDLGAAWLLTLAVQHDLHYPHHHLSLDLTLRRTERAVLTDVLVDSTQEL